MHREQTEILTWALGGENPHKWDRNSFSTRPGLPTKPTVDMLVNINLLEPMEEKDISKLDVAVRHGDMEFYQVTFDGKKLLWELWLDNGGSTIASKPMLSLEPGETFKLHGATHTVIGRHACESHDINLPGSVYLCCSDGWEAELDPWDFSPEVDLVRRDED